MGCLFIQSRSRICDQTPPPPTIALVTPSDFNVPSFYCPVCSEDDDSESGSDENDEQLEPMSANDEKKQRETALLQILMDKISENILGIQSVSN